MRAKCAPSAGAPGLSRFWPSRRYCLASGVTWDLGPVPVHFGRDFRLRPGLGPSEGSSPLDHDHPPNGRRPGAWGRPRCTQNAPRLATRLHRPPLHARRGRRVASSRRCPPPAAAAAAGASPRSVTARQPPQRDGSSFELLCPIQEP
jgi:hypothetical protein